MGMRCVSLSCITNLASGLGDHEIDGEKNLLAAKKGMKVMGTILNGLLQKFPLNPDHKLQTLFTKSQTISLKKFKQESYDTEIENILREI